MSDVATQSKSFLEIALSQWVPLLSLAGLAFQGLFLLKHTIADTKNKDLDTKLKQLELTMKEQAFAEQQKKESKEEDFPVVEYPKFEPIGGSTWLLFLSLAGLNAAAFFFITFTQPLTLLNLGMLIASVVAAGLSFALPLCMVLSKHVAYGNAVHSFTAIRFLYANARLAKLQMSLLQTQGALAKGQFETVNTMLTKTANEAQVLFDRVRNSVTKEQLRMADPVFNEFVEKIRQTNSYVENVLEKVRLAEKKAADVTLLDPEQNANNPS